MFVNYFLISFEIFFIIRVHLCSSVVKMKAVILAAGKGTRMRELTNELPKPMLRTRANPSSNIIVARHSGGGDPRDFHRYRLARRGRSKSFRRRLEMERAHRVWTAGRAGRHRQARILAKEFIGNPRFS